MAQLKAGTTINGVVVMDEFDAATGHGHSAAAGDGPPVAKITDTATNASGVSVAIIATGSYAGNDTASRTITVGFTPKLVIVSGDGSAVRVGIGHYGNGQYGLTAGAASAVAANSDDVRPDPTANGFIVDGAGAPTLNDSGATYYWTAIA